MAIDNTKKKSLKIAEQYADKAQPFTPIKTGRSARDETALTFDVVNSKIDKLNLITFRCFAGKKKIARNTAIDDFLDKYDRDGFLIVPKK